MLITNHKAKDMLADATVGSKVALYHLSKITGEATIEGQTACYWHLSNDERVKKELGFYWESYNKSKCVYVKPWSEEIEVEYQAYLESSRIASVLSAQKSKLDDYIQYMRSGYFGKLSGDQISNILSVCQDQIGDLPRRHTL